MPGMIQETKWYCTTCQSTYDTESEALRCEAAHAAVSVSDISIIFESMLKLPSCLLLELPGGEVASYRRETLTEHEKRERLRRIVKRANRLRSDGPSDIEGDGAASI